MKWIKGSRKEDGHHHDHHHCESISRKDFLARLGLMTAGGTMMLGSAPVQALQSNSLFRKLAGLDSNRVLILLQLDGGNDGLNTIIPYENDLYYNARPSLSIAKNRAMRLTDTLGMHPSMSPLEAMWKEGNMSVIQSVGYENGDLSHFRSTDIWMSASDSDEYLESGWLGRSLDAEFPDFGDNPTEYPLAVQIGGVSSLLFNGVEGKMGMNLSDVELLERLVNEGIVYSLDQLPSTLYGEEMAFLRKQANSSYRYANAIQAAYEESANRVEFDTEQLGRGLSIVSRLIKGNLGSKIYLLSLAGFDTHAVQPDLHASLLAELSQGVADFYEDLAADGRSEEVLIATFSEFGRRVYQNDSQGTDHGTAAPMFIFGEGVNGGIFGNDPMLGRDDLDEYGNMKHEYDFRQVYASLLNDWFRMEESETEAVLGGGFTSIPFIESSFATSGEEIYGPDSFRLEQNYPNPFNPSTRISFNLFRPETVQLEVFDLNGRKVSTLIHKKMRSGSHSIRFNASEFASGVYVYRLRAGNRVQSKTMTLIK